MHAVKGSCRGRQVSRFMSGVISCCCSVARRTARGRWAAVAAVVSVEPLCVSRASECRLITCLHALFLVVAVLKRLAGNHPRIYCCLVKRHKRLSNVRTLDVQIPQPVHFTPTQLGHHAVCMREHVSPCRQPQTHELMTLCTEGRQTESAEAAANLRQSYLTFHTHIIEFIYETTY